LKEHIPTNWRTLMNWQILLTLHRADGAVVAEYPVDGAGAALHIAAEDGAYYQFTDLATGIGPENLTTARTGDDLLIHFDGDGQPDLVIDNYFTRGQGALVGAQENGGLASYPVTRAPEHALASEIITAQPLGADQPALAPLGVLGAVGLAAGSLALARDAAGTANPQGRPARTIRSSWGKVE